MDGSIFIYLDGKLKNTTTKNHTPPSSHYVSVIHTRILKIMLSLTARSSLSDLFAACLGKCKNLTQLWYYLFNEEMLLFPRSQKQLLEKL